MNRTSSLLSSVALLIALNTEGRAEARVPETCPVTLPAAPRFKPPAPYEEGTRVWHGTPALWTSLPRDGIWRSLGARNKFSWWSQNWGPTTANKDGLNLLVSALKLDGETRSIVFSDVENVVEDADHWSMMMSLDFPVSGCWQVTGRLGKESLTFVVWVSPVAGGEPLPGPSGN